MTHGPKEAKTRNGTWSTGLDEVTWRANADRRGGMAVSPR